VDVEEVEWEEEEEEIDCSSIIFTPEKVLLRTATNGSINNLGSSSGSGSGSGSSTLSGHSSSASFRPKASTPARPQLSYAAFVAPVPVAVAVAVADDRKHLLRQQLQQRVASLLDLTKDLVL
jgi:hypothetical protein